MGKVKGSTKGKGTTPKGVVTVTFTPPVKVTPQQRRGTSTTKHPVGVTWVVCLQATHNNKGTPPTRSTLMGLVMGSGVTYNTTRTQVQRYLQWYNNGCSRVNGLPNGVTVPKGLVLTPPTPPTG